LLRNLLIDLHAPFKDKLDGYDSLIRQREVILAAALDPRVKPILSKVGPSEIATKQQLG
jgi:hypothetical protein